MFLNPSTWYQGPGTRDPGTRDQGPGTRDHGPETRDQGPRTRGTRDQGPGTRDQRPRGSQKDAWEAAWGTPGASLVKEDFEGKTSQLAETFDEK